MKRPHVLPLIPVFVTLFTGMAFADPSPTPPPSPPTEAGIEGVITISPIHGGPIRQGEEDSKPLPDTSFSVKQGDQVVATFVTDAAGRFRVALSPGEYYVSRTDQKHTFGKFGPFPVKVTAAKMTQVHWDCDSGLR
jgi:hypothetical protein